MRQQRQASQEALQRRAALQSIADRKSLPRRVLDSSSDSDSSDLGYRPDSPSSSSTSRFNDSSNSRPEVLGAAHGQQKPLRRISKQKENRLQAQLPAVPEMPGQTSRAAATALRMSSEDDQLADSLADLAINDSTTQQKPVATKLAAAIATSLPDEASSSIGPGAAAQNDAEGAAQSSVQPAGLHIAQFQLKPKIANMLYKHQIEGVKWLWSLHRMRRGGILGDCFSYAPFASTAAYPKVPS